MDVSCKEAHENGKSHSLGLPSKSALKKIKKEQERLKAAKQQELKKIDDLRKSKLPKIRVRDVQKKYGHICQIPLHCCIITESARSWNDLVDEEDIHKASNQWDGEGLMEDIRKENDGWPFDW